MKLFFLIILIIFFTINIKAQEINELYVFNYFHKKGFTTATATSQFYDLEKLHVFKIEVSKTDCKILEKIIINIVPKKHFQTKFGIENVFVEMKIDNKLIKAVFSIGKSTIVLTDLTNYKEFWIKNNEQQKWLKELIYKIKLANN